MVVSDPPSSPHLGVQLTQACLGTPITFRVSSLQMSFYLFLLLSLWAVFRAGPHGHWAHVSLSLLPLCLPFATPFPWLPTDGLAAVGSKPTVQSDLS